MSYNNFTDLFLPVLASKVDTHSQEAHWGSYDWETLTLPHDPRHQEAESREISLTCKNLFPNHCKISNFINLLFPFNPYRFCTGKKQKLIVLY